MSENAVLCDAGVSFVEAGPRGEVPAPYRAVRYRWAHVPSGTTGVRTIGLLHAADIRLLLGLWNVLGAGVWLYGPLGEA